MAAHAGIQIDDEAELFVGGLGKCCHFVKPPNGTSVLRRYCVGIASVRGTDNERSDLWHAWDWGQPQTPEFFWKDEGKVICPPSM
ncbi:hypothetical protein [Sulfitobacter aestuariivivens]|uniref:hypothetical protein n=1 Tax=Sulfitobacter aestuariivivens TaxID=2766981 RepID=UPI003621218E